MILLALFHPSIELHQTRVRLETLALYVYKLMKVFQLGMLLPKFKSIQIILYDNYIKWLDETLVRIMGVAAAAPQNFKPSTL